MYFVCPDCKTASWIPMGNGVPVRYTDDGKIICPSISLDLKKIHWCCKCYANRAKVNKNNKCDFKK